MSESAANTARALNTLLAAVARFADAGDDRALKYAETCILLVKAMTGTATNEVPFSTWWREMKDGDGPWEFSIGTHKFGVCNVGCVVMNCLTCRKTFDGGTSKAHLPNWDFTAESVAHMQGAASAHAKTSSDASPRVPEKEAEDIARLHEQVAELRVSRDHWMFCHKEAMGRERMIEVRHADILARVRHLRSIRRLTRVHDQGTLAGAVDDLIEMISEQLGN